MLLLQWQEPLHLTGLRARLMTFDQLQLSIDHGAMESFHGHKKLMEKSTLTMQLGRTPLGSHPNTLVSGASSVLFAS